MKSPSIQDDGKAQEIVDARVQAEEQYNEGETWRERFPATLRRWAAMHRNAMQKRWLGGFRKFGQFFQGDPYEHALEEAYDLIHYLDTLAYERTHWRERAEKAESVVRAFVEDGYYCPIHECITNFEYGCVACMNDDQLKRLHDDAAEQRKVRNSWLGL